MRPSRALVATLACVVFAGCSSLPTAKTSKVNNAEITWLRTGAAAHATVVFESGLGDGMSPWAAVIARLRADWPSKLPGATLRSIEGSGHNIQRDKPGIVASEIRALLNQIPPPAP